MVCTVHGPGGALNLGRPHAYSLVGGHKGVADEGISFERVDDRNTQLRGCTGETLNLRHAGLQGVVKIRLLKTSDVNGLMMQMFKAQFLNNMDWSRNIISLEDRVRGDKMVATECAFAGEAAQAWGKVGAMNEWTFHAGSIDGTNFMGQYNTNS